MLGTEPQEWPLGPPGDSWPSAVTHHPSCLLSLPWGPGQREMVSTKCGQICQSRPTHLLLDSCLPRCTPGKAPPQAGSPCHPASLICSAPRYHLVTWVADNNPHPMQAAQSSSPCRSIAGRVNLSQYLVFKLHIGESENLKRQRILQLGGTEQPAVHLVLQQRTASALGPCHLWDRWVVPIFATWSSFL